MMVIEQTIEIVFLNLHGTLQVLGVQQFVSRE